MYKPLLLLLALVATGSAPVDPPVGIVAQSVPALKESSWTFQDSGNSYFVGKQSGYVVVVRGSAPAPSPTPKPDPTPKPPPIPPVAEKVAWVSLICDPADAQAATYRTDPIAREEFAGAGVEFRTYLATERDIDALGLRQIVTEKGLPLVVTQDKAGKVLEMRRIKDPQDWSIFCTGVTP